MINVVKRHGGTEPLDYEKINKVLLWATENVKHVSASTIAMNAKLQLHDNITTKEIHKVLIQSASSLISETEPNYQYVAANLANYLLRKEVFESVDNLPHIKDVIQKNIDLGVYDSVVLENYTSDELDKLNKLIKHQRDYNFTYAGIQQLIDKYLLKHRKTGVLYETPQYMFMLIAMTLFADVKKEERINKIHSFYNDISLLKINLPTPVMSGVRTPSRTYSSCTLIDVDDTLDSIIASNGAVTRYTASKAGIGLNFGRIRALGDSIRNGEVVHTGVIPFLKHFEAATKSTTQNGVRGGNSTTHFPFWHKEIEDILVLKNNKGATENRVRGMDYSIQFNRLFYKRVVENGNITLFSPGDSPTLYELFFKDNDKFEELYVRLENNKNIKKSVIGARELFNSYIQERIGTGRIYLFNTDHVNTHSSFKDSVTMSNLCVAPETKILTDQGYITIGDNAGKEVNVWNGEEFSTTTIVKTGENQKLIKISFSNGQTIECTEYHKFYLETSDDINKEVRANELQVSDVIQRYVIDGEIISGVTVTKIEDLGRTDDTYCVNEPKRHKVIFNGIITGNCQEITLPTTPITDLHTENGEIALCVLSAINLGELKNLDELEGLCENILRGLDFIIEKQDYPVPAARKMLKRRSVGVGITNLAYYLAKNNLTYTTPETLPFVDELMEHIQYYLIKASVKLAKEYGKCEYFDQTKYSSGILPIDTYCKNVDKIVNRPLTLDWESLRQEILTHGMRNSTLTAIMPCESSSVVSNSTNGIEPVRSLLTTKTSKQGTLKMVVPEISKLKNKYQLAFEIGDNKHLINIQAIIQKYIDQAISSNHYYNATKNGGEIPISQVSTDILYSYQMGLKTLYYANTEDGNSDDLINELEKTNKESNSSYDVGCESGACSV
jgi:ribonucleotide reductase alpha subunit